MKNFQIRLADDVYDEIKSIATERNTTIADIIRQSLELYAIGAMYAREGKRLMWENPRSGERADVLIPGLTLRAARGRTTDEATPTDLVMTGSKR